MRTIVILATLAALNGCWVVTPQWAAEQRAREAAERANPKPVYDTSAQDFAAYMSILQYTKPPTISPMDVMRIR